MVVISEGDGEVGCLWYWQIQILSLLFFIFSLINHSMTSPTSVLCTSLFYVTQGREEL